MSEAQRSVVFRVSPPHEFEEDLNKLTTPQPGRDYPLFSSKQKAMMFAASLGYYRGQRHDVPFRRGTAIRLEVFQQNFDDRYLDALAVVAENELGILAPDRSPERGKIFEEYAYSGVREIVDRCIRSPGDPLQALVELTELMRDGQKPEVANIDPAILRSLINF